MRSRLTRAASLYQAIPLTLSPGNCSINAPRARPKATASPSGTPGTRGAWRTSTSPNWRGWAAAPSRVVNKTPLNLLRLGLIGALFPGARIIWCRRDLRDVVVSQHTMFFGEGNIYSTDQSDCAFAARQIERIGEAWRGASTLPILEVVYEDLVADLETHVRRIVDFLDLPWEPACLDFQNTSRHVDTPSSWQVRQPIYSTSVGRWRRFEKHLGPMLATLAEPLDALPAAGSRGVTAPNVTARFSPPRRIGANVPSMAVKPVDVDALVLSGMEAHGEGRLVQARELYGQALAARPDHPDALNLAGVLAFQTGDTAEAIRLIGKAVKILPTHKDAQLNFAEALEAAARVDDAVAALKRVLAIEPDSVEAHVRLARLFLTVGSTALALSHATVAAALDPLSAEAPRERSVALRRLMKYEEAVANVDRALELAPDDVTTLSIKGSLLNEMDLAEAAEACYRRALSLAPDHRESLLGLATVLQGRNKVGDALVLIERARAAHPNDAEIYRARAMALRDNGDFEGARGSFEASLEIDPDNAGALYGLVRMKRLADTPAERTRLTRMTSGANPRYRERVVAGFVLGEMLDRANEPDAAFSRFSEANALHRKQRAARGDSFDAEELRSQTELTETVLAPAFAKETAGWGNSIASPVFIVGLPRSGTTLVEQICASHSQVAGGGELRLIEVAARRMGEHNAGARSIAEWEADFARARADEIAAEFERIGHGATRVVDKTPLNLMRLGVVGALLPNARVIWCRRDPRDTVVSLHLTYFAARQRVLDQPDRLRLRRPRDRADRRHLQAAKSAADPGGRLRGPGRRPGSQRPAHHRPSGTGLGAGRARFPEHRAHGGDAQQLAGPAAGLFEFHRPVAAL